MPTDENSPLLQALPHVFLFFGLMSSSTSTRASFFILISLGAELVKWSSIVTTVANASDLLLITDISKLRTVGQKVNGNDLGLWERIKRALRLMSSTRHTGWTHEPRHVLPPHPTGSRWAFIGSRIIHCIGYYAVSDVLNTYKCYSPAFTRGGVSMAKGGVPMRLLNTAVHVAHTWSMLSLLYTLACIVAVVSHLSDVSECPASFGNWSDAYTVRRLWGRTWHQNLRRVLTVHGDFVAFNLLHLKKDTFLATNIQRYVAFALSGAIHAAGEHGMFRSQYREHSTAMTFFFLQATVIMVEQEINKILSIKPGKWSRRAGYVWTFCWFAWTLPSWFDPQFIHGPQYRYGALERDLFWGSVTNLLWKGEWNMRPYIEK
ncbi:membrane bound O-acyl transferase family-domain-containing protein [Cyathus striatus]|nr:membrane bound O-acyl transferase family-domain-containing protein [Cyathus striatus]